MNVICFVLGLLTAAVLGLAVLVAALLLRGRKPPDRKRAKDFERQLGNLLRYDGTGKNQKEADDDGDHH